MSQLLLRSDPGIPGVRSMRPDVCQLTFLDLTDVTLVDEDTNSIKTRRQSVSKSCINEPTPLFSGIFLSFLPYQHPNTYHGTQWRYAKQKHESKLNMFKMFYLTTFEIFYLQIFRRAGKELKKYPFTDLIQS